MSTPPLEVNQSTPADATALEQIRTGQRLIIFAILANFLFAYLRSDGQAYAWIAAVLALVMAVAGILRVTAGLRYSTLGQVGVLIVQLVPLVNIVMLLVLNGKATKALRAGGYKVGFFGAPARAAV